MCLEAARAKGEGVEARGVREEVDQSRGERPAQVRPNLYHAMGAQGVGSRVWGVGCGM